tara:strand:+ start:26 stop:331 length:306 start_codon:yes stop_codon:yes gene_type:complete
MATITHGENKRTDVSSRSAPIFSDDATYSRVHTVTIASDEGITYLTGSLSNPSGFMVKTAGQGVLTATDGGDIPAGDVTADEIYPIGVKEISGSCTVHLVY